MVPVKFYAAAIGVLLMMLALLGGGWYAHHQGYAEGAASVQAKWDEAKAAAATVAVKAANQSATTEHAQATSFGVIESTYIKANDHAFPSLAPGLPAAFAAGTVRLRDNAACPASSGIVSEATARSRAADAAATQALADRVRNSIAAVRTGDAAVKREQQLDAQVIALQQLLQAERAPQP